MALIPARVKFRRVHRLPYEGKAKGNTTLSFGEFGLMAKEGGWITTNQIEAARVAMTRYMKRGGKVWINIFSHMPVTSKPLGTRQGKGKGNPEVYSCGSEETGKASTGSGLLSSSLNKSAIMSERDFAVR